MTDLVKLHQVTMEDKYDRRNIREKVFNDVMGSLESSLELPIQAALDGMMEYVSIEHPYVSKNTRAKTLKFAATLAPIDILVEMLLLIIPVKGPQPIQAIVGRLAKYMPHSDLLDRLKTASDLVAIGGIADLFDIIPASVSVSGSLMIESRFELNPETVEYISNTKYLPPMLCPPVELTGNFGPATLTHQESVILGNINHHNKPVALDTLNISNGIALSLDIPTMMTEETSKKPLDTPEKIASFHQMKTSSQVVYSELVDAGNKFYLRWRFDMRGRSYSQGYHVNMQGTSYKKSLINLHEKHVITGV